MFMRLERVNSKHECLLSFYQQELLEMAMSVRSSHPSSHALLFVVGQLFCHSCEASRCLPNTGSSHLFMWSLELLMNVEELVKNEDTEDASLVVSSVDQERRTFFMALDTVPSLEQRTTLKQKLNVIFPS